MLGLDFSQLGSVSTIATLFLLYMCVSCVSCYTLWVKAIITFEPFIAGNELLQPILVRNIYTS